MADIWYLPPELNSKHCNYKYVLDVIDHFTKFTNSFLLNSKESLEIFAHIKNFFIIYGHLKYLATDNGSEFKNKIWKKFMQ